MIAYGDSLDRKQILKAVNALQDGCILIVPTDGFYCFVCDINNHKAAERLAKLKDKKLSRADFSILCASISMASQYTKPLSKEQFLLLKNNTPGGFTFIFQASNQVPKIFLSKKRTIGIRIPNCKIALQIAESLGSPLLVSSVPHADDTEQGYANASLLEERFSDCVEMVIESDIPSNKPSTVVDFTKGAPEIVRYGLGELEL